MIYSVLKKSVVILTLGVPVLGSISIEGMERNSNQQVKVVLYLYSQHSLIPHIAPKMQKTVTVSTETPMGEVVQTLVKRMPPKCFCQKRKIGDIKLASGDIWGQKQELKNRDPIFGNDESPVSMWASEGTIYLQGREQRVDWVDYLLMGCCFVN